MSKFLLISHDFLPGLPGGIAFFYHHLCYQMQATLQVLVPHSGAWQAFDARQPYTIHRRAIPITTGLGRRAVRVQALFLIRNLLLALTQFVLYTWHGYRLIRRESIDCIWMGHLYMAPLGWLLSQLTRRPYCIFLHGSELQRYWHIGLVRRVMLAFLNRAAFLIVNSHFTRRQYVERGVRADQKFVQVYPGVDVTRFHPGVDPAPIIARHKLAERAVILTVSRLVAWKGQDTVLRAMPRILAQVPNALYLIAGTGPARPDLEQLVAALGLQAHVILAGFVPADELARYYRAADVVVLLSREVQLVDPAQGGASKMPIEGFGMVYTEANATGRPVIGSNMGATAESIEVGVTGLVVDPSDETAVTEAIVHLLTHPDVADQMGQAGYERVTREFTWAYQTERLRQQLNELGYHK